MKYLLFIIIFLTVNSLCLSQVKRHITIKGIEYEVKIDTINHDIIEVDIVEEETFGEKFYIGCDMMFYGNLEPKVLWDCSEYGKIGIGYDIGNKAFTVTSYISLGRLRKRKDIIDAIYF